MRPNGAIPAGRLALSLGVLALAVTCLAPPDYVGKTCTVDCPEGLVCVQGFCAVPDGSIAAGDARPASADAATPGLDAAIHALDASPGEDASPGDSALLGEDAAQSGHDAAPPGADAAQAGEDAAGPGTDAAHAGQDAAQPGMDAAQAGQDAARPGLDAAQAGQDAAQPGPDAGVPRDDAGCPFGRGPVMVNVGLFCIDSTEVTNSQYNEFLLSSPSLAGQPSYCSWNTSYLPGGGWTYDPAAKDFPISFVDWCDAYAFCAWAGKRMCGAIGGGSLSMSDAANAAVDQRYYACSHAGSLVYPYGNTYDPTACNGADYGTGKATAAGSLPSCEGGYPGLFDLTGNVEEWQDACDGTTGPLDNCLDGSGAFDYPGSGPTGTRCDFYDSDSRSVQYYDIGIRCCYP